MALGYWGACHCIGPSERDLRQAPRPRRLETMTGCPSRPEVLVGEMHTKVTREACEPCRVPGWLNAVWAGGGVCCKLGPALS